ncbi:MAG: mRNA surveillance protein pelota [Candidatus Methanomethylicia archaeon]
MRIVEINDAYRVLKLKVEYEDDLWVLYNILSVGDIVYAKTTRELKTSSGSKRKSMVLGVKVEWTEFQPFTTRLRVHGIIVEGPRELDLVGQRHTLKVDVGDEVLIYREKRWSSSDIEYIDKYSKKGYVNALAIGIDYDEVAIAIIRDYGIEEISSFPLNLPGKDSPENREEVVYSRAYEIANMVINECRKREVNIVVIAGLGSLKNILKNRLEDMDKKIKIYLEDTSTGGISAIYEALRREAVMKILEDYSIVEEEKLIGEFLEKLSENVDIVRYGLSDVEKVVEYGVIEKVMVVSELVRSYNEEERRRVEEVLRKAESMGAKIKIFTSTHETYNQLKQLGGIAAILRFKLSRHEAC